MSASYRPLSATAFALEVSNWDELQRLVIDPAVLYSTCLGGSNNEVPFAVAARGDVTVVGGSTLSWDFPITPGAFQATPMGFDDAYVTSFSEDGTSLVYSTLLGGGTWDSVSDITIGPDGMAIVAGSAGSGVGFPVTPGAYDVTHNGQTDGFVAKLSADGTNLIFSTFLGGDDADPVSNVRIAVDGTFYVTGLTESHNFPTTPNAFASTLTASSSAYVARFSPDGSQLLASTLLGGDATTKGRGLGVDAAGNAYITGYVSIFSFPVTPGAFDTTPNGQADAFVAKFAPDLSSLIYCTYLGGEDFDEAWGLALDADGAACVTGFTKSKAFPTTPGAWDAKQNGNVDAFVTKLDPTGSFLEFSTYLGGGGNTRADDIAVGADGSVFDAGDLDQFVVLFPLTPDGWDTTYAGASDAFLVRFDPAGSKATYSTLIGGSFGEEGRAMCLDEHGDAFVAGEAFSPDFPTTPGVFDPTMTDFKDTFVVRFTFGPWTVLDGELAGTGGVTPYLSAWGALEPGSAGELSLIEALPNTPATLVLGLSPLDAPFKGGTLVPTPVALIALVTSPAGEVHLSWTDWPAGIPQGTEFYVQAWVSDPAGPKGYAASQGLEATTP